MKKQEALSLYHRTLSLQTLLKQMGKEESKRYKQLLASLTKLKKRAIRELRTLSVQ